MTRTDIWLYRAWIGGYWHKTEVCWFPVDLSAWNEHEVLQHPWIIATEDNTQVSVDAHWLLAIATVLVSVGVAFGYVCL